jgi:streptomycin 6-kinase
MPICSIDSCNWDLLAWTGLSAAWMIEDEIDPATPLEAAKLAALALCL